ncbi:UNVERIFIED_CONTAM: hypothetical protein Sindi_1849900, partial [Sesamum indicum]
LEDVPTIMLRIKQVYATPDRHIRYAATKEFFRTKMTEGFSVQRHGVKIFPSRRSSKTSKLGLTMSRETLTSKAKGKKGGSWKRKKGKGKVTVATFRAPSTPVALVEKEKGKG